ncbi:cytochrome b/b6 domain-containing protein [Brackiella oedipodis]|uniref:cytochrome b/b6 domain-containing protein n=1 Tax=Brackiella oedipodis TaxID=124225 RepID=UPI000AEA8922|nr:cytochrome b/b6 domain-containing protein [Brackiella oedipodis]
MFKKDKLSTVNIWDWPTRICNWLLFIATLLAIFSMQGLLYGQESQQELFDSWHRRSIYAVLTLVLFRIVWGFIGTYYARFQQFLKSPKAIYEFVMSKKYHRFGHNPLAGLSIVMILVLLLLWSATDFLIYIPDAYKGILSHHLPEGWQDSINLLHFVSGCAALLVVVIHMTIFSIFLFKHKLRVIRPFFTGRVLMINEISVACLDVTHEPKLFVKAIIALACCALFVYWLTTLGEVDTLSQAVPFKYIGRYM